MSAALGAGLMAKLQSNGSWGLFFSPSNGAALPDPPPENAVSLPVVLQITRRQKDRGGAMLTVFCRRRECGTTMEVQNDGHQPPKLSRLNVVYISTISKQGRKATPGAQRSHAKSACNSMQFYPTTKIENIYFFKSSSRNVRISE